MDNQSSDKLEPWLPRTQLFTSLYERTIGEASTIVFSRKLEEDFLTLIPEGGKILEIGSGPGLQAMQILQSRPDLKIVAADYSAEMISLAKKNYQQLILKNKQIRRIESHLSFVQADAMNLSQFGSETFDAIYSVMTIKHFADPIRGLHECTRILKSGGRMFFSEFFAEASLANVKNFAQHFQIADCLKPIVASLIHRKIGKNAPDKVEVEKWKNKLRSKCFFLAEHLQGYPFLILKLKKNKSSK